MAACCIEGCWGLAAIRHCTWAGGVGSVQVVAWGCGVTGGRGKGEGREAERGYHGASGYDAQLCASMHGFRAQTNGFMICDEEEEQEEEEELCCMQWKTHEPRAN